MDHQLPAEVIRAAQLVNYFSAAGMTLMVADYLHTLPQEVRLVWPTKVSLPKLIFLSVRYGNFLFAALVYLYSLTPGPVFSPDGCRRMFIAIGILEVSLTTLGEAIIYVRVWAFSGCNRKILYLLASLFVVLDILSFTFFGKYSSSMRVLQAPPSTHLNCLCVSGGSEVTVSALYGLMVISVTCLMTTMVAIGVVRYNETGIRSAYRGLVIQFYKDGITYFLMLLLLNVMNIFTHSVGKHGFQYLFVKVQVYLHGMVAVRMILHLRSYAEKERYLSLGLEGEPAVADFRMVNETAKARSILRFASVQLLESTVPTVPYHS